MIISAEVEAVSDELLKKYCIGKRRLGNKKAITKKLLEMIISNCLYYNNYDIAVQ